MNLLHELKDKMNIFFIFQYKNRTILLLGKNHYNKIH